MADEFSDAWEHVSSPAQRVIARLAAGGVSNTKDRGVPPLEASRAALELYGKTRNPKHLLRFDHLAERAQLERE